MGYLKRNKKGKEESMKNKSSLAIGVLIFALLTITFANIAVAQEITYAYLPQYSVKESLERHSALIEYLKRETDLEIKQVFPNDFDEHMNQVGSSEIDISYSNPFVYIKIAHRYGTQAFARVIEREGAEKFRGEICVLKDSPIKILADLKEKKLIAVSDSSAGGYLFQRGMLVEAGIDPDSDLTIHFAKGIIGEQEESFMGMYTGAYDACFVREGTRTIVMKDKVDISKVRVLAYTPWYPGWVYAARKGLDPYIVVKIKAALAKLDANNADQRKILDKAKFVKVVSSKDSDFDSIRELAKKLKISLDK